MEKGITAASAQALKHATADEIYEVTSSIHDVHSSIVDANSELDNLYDALKATENVVDKYNHMSKLCRSMMQELSMKLH